MRSVRDAKLANILVECHGSREGILKVERDFVLSVPPFLAGQISLYVLVKEKLRKYGKLFRQKLVGKIDRGRQHAEPMSAYRVGNALVLSC